MKEESIIAWVSLSTSLVFTFASFNAGVIVSLLVKTKVRAGMFSQSRTKVKIERSSPTRIRTGNFIPVRTRAKAVSLSRIRTRAKAKAENKGCSLSRAQSQTKPRASIQILSAPALNRLPALKLRKALVQKSINKALVFLQPSSDKRFLKRLKTQHPRILLNLSSR